MARMAFFEYFLFNQYLKPIALNFFSANLELIFILKNVLSIKLVLTKLKIIGFKYWLKKYTKNAIRAKVTLVGKLLY